MPKSVELPRRKTFRVGRNQSCPCGSGRKYKDCHASEGQAYLDKLVRDQERKKLLQEQKDAGVPWYKRLITKALH
jgi:hypothetical protein